MCCILDRKKCHDSTDDKRFRQNGISSLLYWSNSTAASQCWAHMVDITQCLVSILAIFPMIEAVEIIRHVNEANLRADKTKSKSRILSMVAEIVSNLLSLIAIVPLPLFQTIASQVIVWHGSQTDFSSLDKQRWSNVDEKAVSIYVSSKLWPRGGVKTGRGGVR